MLGIFLSLCVALLASLGQVAGKIATQKSEITHIDEYSLSLGIRIFSSLLLFPALFFFSFPSSFSFKDVFLIFWVVLLSAISTITSLQAVKYGDISVVGPIGSLALPLLLVTSYIFTGELPNSAWYIWVGIIFLWLYCLEGNLRNGFFSPFRAMMHDRGAKAMMITTLIQSVTAPLDKIGIWVYGIIPWIFLTSFLSVPLILMYMYFSKKDISLRLYTQLSYIKKVSILSIVMGGGLILQMLALKLTLIIYVISLKRTSGMISVLLGWLIFKEQDIAKKFFASALMFVWALVIIFYGNI
jgi:uncharacterized membrane protein